MSNIMKLTDVEVKEYPLDVVKKIEKVIRGEEKNSNVQIQILRAPGAYWHTTFGGISIETCDENYKTVHRRVKRIFVKSEGRYEIDLDKIKEKYKEVKKLALEFEAKRKRIDKEREENKNLITKLKGDTEHIDIKGSGECFTVEIWSLNEEEVKKVVEFAKTLKDKQ
jgi:hypothetical protein